MAADEMFDEWMIDGSVDEHPRALAEMFAAVGARLTEHRDTATVVQALAELAVRVVPGVRWASITRGRGDRFTTMAASDPIAAAADQLQYRLGTGPCIDAVINDAVFASNDLALDSRWAHFGPQAARNHGTRSVLSMRLAVEGDDDLNAGLNMYGDHIDAFDELSRFLATMLAAHAAVAVAAAANREHAVNLQAALSASREIGVAMGVLMSRHVLTRDEAFGLLRLASQNTNRRLRDIATDVADTGTLDLPAVRRRP